MKNTQMDLVSRCKAVIFDMDGTLYYQFPLRLHMALWLLVYYLVHPLAIRELVLLYHYRRIRENWKGNPACSEKGMEKQQYAQAAGMAGLTAKDAERVVCRWMKELPLKILGIYRDERIAAMFGRLKEKGILRIVYSDYPAYEKIMALGLEADYIFCSEDVEIDSLKPDPKGLRIIMEKTGLTPGDLFMIGDSVEKDGKAALGAGIAGLIVSPFPWKRKIQLRKVMEE